MTKQEIITKLNLIPHPYEGGYFIRTYESSPDTTVKTAYGNRLSMTSIFYMLTEENPILYLHKNKSDITHYFHLGSPLSYHTINPAGELTNSILGPNLLADHRLQLIVPGGHWKACILETGEFGLISEAVSPGFAYEDSILAEAESFKSEFPAFWPQMKKFIKS